MDNHQSNPFHDLPAPTSFSFENSHHNYLPRRSIGKCLKLITNQSFEDRQVCSIDKGKQNKKGLRTQQSQIDADHYLRLAQEEYTLRMESLTKQYELRLNKQEQYYGLREWKLKEQMENLEKQNSVLTEELRRTKNAQKQNLNQCSLCSDGQVIAHYSKVLAQNEQNHKGCLIQKTELTRKVNLAQSKLQILQKEHQKAYLEVRTLNKQIRSYQSKVKQIESQRDTAIQSVFETDFMWKEKLSKMEGQLKYFQREFAQRERIQLHQSKATIQSTQPLLTNPHISLRSSLLNFKDPREEKENQQGKMRPSLNKLIAISDDDCQNQNRPCHRKFSQTIYRNGKSIKREPLRWKYF